MTITSFDKKMFHQAYIEATKSTFDRFHVGAVIAYKGHIIGRGHNSTKTHPMQQRYDMKYRAFNNYKTGDFIYLRLAQIDFARGNAVFVPAGR